MGGSARASALHGSAALVLTTALLPATTGCSGLMTLTGGYAQPLSSRADQGGFAVHGGLGAGGGSRGTGAGFGTHLRYKSLPYSDEFAFGAHLYMLSMSVKSRPLGGFFTETGEWGGYGRFGVNVIEFESYEGDGFVSTLGPSLDVGMLMPLGLTAGLSVERDIRFAGHPDEAFAFLMIGFGAGAVGPF